MLRISFGIAGVLVVAALVGMSFMPAASATRYTIDITKTVHGYTIHIVGWIDVDQQARTITGHLHITVSENGKVLFETDIDFTYTWSSTPPPITFLAPAPRLLVTISFTTSGLDVNTVPLLNPMGLQLRRGRLNLDN